MEVMKWAPADHVSPLIRAWASYQTSYIRNGFLISSAMPECSVAMYAGPCEPPVASSQQVRERPLDRKPFGFLL